MLALIILSLILVTLFSYYFSELVDYMNTNHREYKGDDFLELPNSKFNG